MPTGKRITLPDVAHAAQVNKSTVSLALRNDPRVKEATRKRIQRIAKELGYQPDARFSQLMSFMRNADAERKHQTIAYLRFEGEDDLNLDKIPFFWEFRQGAISELERLGYKVCEFFLRAYEFKYRRLSDVLYHRGIKGLLVSPPPKVTEITGFDWSKFAAITMGYRLRFPKLNRVVCDQFVIIRIVFEHLAQMGYSRPLLAYRKGRDSHVNRRWSTAFHGILNHFHSISETDVYVGDPDQSFVDQVKLFKPDCVIGLSYAFAKTLLASGITFPQDMGFILLDRHDGPINVTSVDQQPFYLGQIAARQLSAAIAGNELGLPENPFTIMTNPRWIDGETTRAPKSNC